LGWPIGLGATWVINEKGNVLARTTVQHVPALDLKSDQVKEKANAFERL
jgi:hypothetical protein